MKSRILSILFALIAAGSNAVAKTVIVAKGDTVYSIARRHGADPKGVIADNRLKAPYSLRPGMKLKIETGAPEPAAGRKIKQTYIVSPGETVYSISRKFEIAPAALVKANDIRNNSLTVGQKLSIPERGATFAAATAPKKNDAGRPPANPAEKPDPPKKTFAIPKAGSIARPDSREGGAFAWPVKGKVLQHFGSVSKGQSNDGINIAAAFGDGVKASENGVVAYAGTLKSFGNLVLVKHADGYITAYGHNDKLLVRRGEQVKKGQVVALAGTSGGVETPQVHFEIRKGTKAVDPMHYLKK